MKFFVIIMIIFYNTKIYKHEIQVKIQGLNIRYKSNAYNEAAQYN